MDSWRVIFEDHEGKTIQRISVDGYRVSIQFTDGSRIRFHVAKDTEFALVEPNRKAS